MLRGVVGSLCCVRGLASTTENYYSLWSVNFSSPVYASPRITSLLLNTCKESRAFYRWLTPCLVGARVKRVVSTGSSGRADALQLCHSTGICFHKCVDAVVWRCANCRAMATEVAALAMAVTPVCQ